MLWNTLFWWLFWESSAIILTTWNSIVFNNYALQTENIIIDNATIDNLPQVEYNDYNLPRMNWMWFNSKFYRSRDIRITWILKCNTELDLQILIDDLKKNLTKENWLFKYICNWQYRCISANCTDFKIPKEYYNLTWTPFEITLKTLESFFYIEQNETVVDNSSSSPRTIQVNNEGSAVSLPQCYLTFTWVSWTNSISFNLWNKTLIYTWTITSWDIITFDSLNKQVLKNGILVEYNWTFPELNIDINSLIFTINWTFTCNYIISYRKNFF